MLGALSSGASPRAYGRFPDVMEGGPRGPLNPNPPMDKDGRREDTGGGEGVTSAMIRARIRIDGRLAGDLQALLGHCRRPTEAVVREMAG